MKTNKDYTFEDDKLGKITVPKGTELTHMTASGPDINYHFVKNLDWYKSILGNNDKNSFAYKMEIWDLEHRGINVPKEYVDFEGSPDLVSKEDFDNDRANWNLEGISTATNGEYIYSWDSNLSCWVKTKPLDKRMVIKIKFEGIDDWHRPVFKHVSSNRRYGDVNNLFSYSEIEGDKFQKFLKMYENNPNYYLEYFGRSFGCEPNGGLSKNTKLQIVKNK